MAAEARFANAGVLAPGYVTPWAAPGMRPKVLSLLFDRHAAVRCSARSALAHRSWLWQWWRACRPSAYQTNRAAMQALAQLSRKRLQALTRSAVVDERFKVAVTRLGQRVRVAGSAELGGDLATINQAALATLYRVLDDWFPGASRLRESQVWKGARPMLPDGAPILGGSGVPGVWLNLGHGSSGWALACGSARVLADRLGGRDPALDLAGFALARLRR